MATLDQTNAYIDALEQSTIANNDANLATQQSALSDRAAAYQQMLAQQKQGASEAVQQATTPNISQTNQSRLYGSYLNEIGNAQTTQQSMQTNLDYLGTVARNVNSINNLNTQINSWSAKAAALIDAYNASSASSGSGRSSYTFSDTTGINGTTDLVDSTENTGTSDTNNSLTGSWLRDISLSLGNTINSAFPISSTQYYTDSKITQLTNSYLNKYKKKYSGDTSESADETAYYYYNKLKSALSTGGGLTDTEQAQLDSFANQLASIQGK